MRSLSLNNGFIDGLAGAGIVCRRLIWGPTLFI